MTTHHCPPEGSGVMPCCGRTPFEVSRTDRMAEDPALVTCGPDRVVDLMAALEDSLRTACAEREAALASMFRQVIADLPYIRPTTPRPPQDII